MSVMDMLRGKDKPLETPDPEGDPKTDDAEARIKVIEDRLAAAEEARIRAEEQAKAHKDLLEQERLSRAAQPPAAPPAYTKEQIEEIGRAHI